jgi:aspartate/methionine/tyrosine aminotransferase
VSVRWWPSRARLAQVEKFLDTVTICPNQLGQRAALWGMRNLGQWLAGERAEILDRRARWRTASPGSRAGGFWAAGPISPMSGIRSTRPSDAVAQRLVREAGVLMLPGTMFTPEGSPAGRRQLRIAFANVDRAGIARSSSGSRPSGSRLARGRPLA